MPARGSSGAALQPEPQLPSLVFLLRVPLVSRENVGGGSLCGKVLSSQSAVLYGIRGDLNASVAIKYADSDYLIIERRRWKKARERNCFVSRGFEEVLHETLLFKYDQANRSGSNCC